MFDDLQACPTGQVAGSWIVLEFNDFSVFCTANLESNSWNLPKH